MTELPRRPFPFNPSVRQMQGRALGSPHERSAVGALAQFDRELDHYLDLLWEEIARPINATVYATNAGQVTVSGAGTTGAATLNIEEPDTSFQVLLTPVTVSSGAAAGASRVRSVAKTVTGITVTVEAAPGAGESVVFDYVVVRVPAT